MLAGLIGLVSVTALLSADDQSTAARVGTRRISTAVECAGDLGMGAKSRRRFCDVLIADTGGGSIRMVIPPHVGVSTLRFDLHNRFLPPADGRTPAESFSRHTALVAIASGTGEPIGRAAVTREFRTVDDLFDRITSGGQPGGLKAVAPGPVEAVVVAVPEGVSSVAIIGISLEVFTQNGRTAHDAPGRPVAIASNFRIEYTPQ